MVLLNNHFWYFFLCLIAIHSLIHSIFDVSHTYQALLAVEDRAMSSNSFMELCSLLESQHYKHK